ncbi:hypothetical protein ACFLQK_01210 [bacterium]
MIVVFCTPLAIKGPYKKEPFDRRPIFKIRETRPAFIFIGNSLLKTRIDEEVLNRKLGAGRALCLGVNRTFSAHWFLQLKNYVVHSGHKPEAVFIFFSDTVLTNPERNTGEETRKSIEKMSRPREPLLNKVLSSDMGFFERAGERARGIYSIRVYREELERFIRLLSYVHVSPRKLVHQLDSTFPGIFKRIIPNSEKRPEAIKWQRFLYKVNNTFSLNNKDLRKISGEDAAPREVYEQLDFDGRLNSSFLPHIARLGKKHDLNLVFVRVQHRPAPNGETADSWQMRKYMRYLEEYIERRGFVFYDFSGDPLLTRDMYLDLWHIDPKSRQKYTRIFVRRMADILE